MYLFAAVHHNIYILYILLSSTNTHTHTHTHTMCGIVGIDVLDVYMYRCIDVLTVPPSITSPPPSFTTVIFKREIEREREKRKCGISCESSRHAVEVV